MRRAPRAWRTRFDATRAFSPSFVSSPSSLDRQVEAVAIEFGQKPSAPRERGGDPEGTRCWSLRSLHTHPSTRRSRRNGFGRSVTSRAESERKRRHRGEPRPTRETRAEELAPRCDGRERHTKSERLISATRARRGTTNPRAERLKRGAQTVCEANEHTCRLRARRVPIREPFELGNDVRDPRGSDVPAEPPLREQKPRRGVERTQ